MPDANFDPKMNEGFIQLRKRPQQSTHQTVVPGRGKGGKKAYVHKAEFELRPGFAPSTGILELPVLMDGTRFIQRASAPAPGVSGSVVTGLGREKNSLDAVVRVGASFQLSSPVRVGKGTTKLYEEAGPEDYDPKDAIKATELFNNEFDLSIKSVRLDGEGNERENDIKIVRLRASDIVPMLPVQLNRIVMCRVTIQDRRIDWQKLYNFSDEINVLKGIMESGQRAYWPYSISNPADPRQQRRAWFLGEVILYLLGLMGEARFSPDKFEGVKGAESPPSIGGNRKSGFDFSDGALGRMFHPDVFNADILSETPENIVFEGGSPVKVLSDLLKRYALTPWFTHESKVLICSKTGQDNVPEKMENDAQRDVLPQYDNIHNRRSRKVILMGKRVRAQEKFELTTVTNLNTKITDTSTEDFEYVAPMLGEFYPLRELWKMAHVANPISRLPVITAITSDGDVNKIPTTFEQSLDPLAAGMPLRVLTGLQAAKALADGAFRYIRLRRQGKYTSSRIPIEHLLSLDPSGNLNQPMIIGETFNIIDSNKEAKDKEIKEKVTTRTYIRTGKWPQHMRLVDKQNLIFQFDKPLVFPLKKTSFTPDRASSAPVVSGGGPQFRNEASRLRFAKQQARKQAEQDMHNSFNHQVGAADILHKWDYEKKITILVASVLDYATEQTEHTIPGDRYHLIVDNESDKAQVSNVQPPLIIYEQAFQPDIILQTYNGNNQSIESFRQGDHLSAVTDVLSEMRNTAEVISASPGKPSVVDIGQGEQNTKKVNILEEARKGTYGKKVQRTIKQIDARAEFIIDTYLNSNTANNSVDYEYARIFRPLGVSPQEGADNYQYKDFLSAIYWQLDDDGCRTIMRFANRAPVRPDLYQSEGQALERINAVVANHRLNELQAGVEAMLRAPSHQDS